MTFYANDNKKTYECRWSRMVKGLFIYCLN